MATLDEQETIITANRVDKFVSIYTSNTHDIAYFRKDARYELVREWLDAETGNVEAAEFRIPQDRVNLRKLAKREVNMTAEQKAKLVERLNNARNSN